MNTKLKLFLKKGLKQYTSFSFKSQKVAGLYSDLHLNIPFYILSTDLKEMSLLKTIKT